MIPILIRIVSSPVIANVGYYILRHIGRKTIIVPTQIIDPIDGLRLFKVIGRIPASYWKGFSKFSILLYSMMSIMSTPQVINVYNSIKVKALHLGKGENYVREMKMLDRSKFSCVVNVPCLKIPVKCLNNIQIIFRKDFFKCKKVKPIIDLDASDPLYKEYKLILLDGSKYKCSQDFTQKQIDTFELNDVSYKDMSMFSVNLAYENWEYEEVFHVVLPPDIEGISSFTLIGHICHLNLKKELLDYKKFIGDVLLDKVPKALTIINKVDIIENTFRTFNYEVIAGKNDMITSTRENNVTFHMDFAKVYWNSRLGREHERIIELINKGDVLFDVFSGIGPFAVPAARHKKARVWANDLNPESYKWLTTNLKVNKATARCFNLDGREFIQTVMKRELLNLWDTDSQCQCHVVMNLPSIAMQFLDVLPHLFLAENMPKYFMPPIVYCYCFSSENDYEKDSLGRLNKVLNVEYVDCSVHFVRDVAPNKSMLCLQFKLDKDYLFAKCKRKLEAEGTTVAKRIRIQ